MKTNSRYVIVGKGFNKYAVTGKSKLTGGKALAITWENDKVETCICFTDDDAIRNLIRALSKLLTNDPRWIPLTVRPATPEEKEDGFPNNIWNCEVPKPYQRILISLCDDKGNGEDIDMALSGEDDDGLFLEGYSWDDVNAWMPLPEPYIKEET